MNTSRTAHRLFVAAMFTALVVVVDAAKIKIEVQHDKTFAFAGLSTFAWHPSGPGDVKVIQNSGDDPAAIRARVEPVIKGAVEQALAGRKFSPAAGAPDLHLMYYVLVGPNISAQTVGQFVGNVPEWGLPPFSGATQAIEIYEQGTLILDISSVKENRVVWRGSARAELDRQNNLATRDARIRTAVQDMLKKFPPKK